MVKRDKLLIIWIFFIFSSYYKELFSNVRIEPQRIDLGYVFIKDDPKVNFNLINFSDSATFIIKNQNLKCELNYVPTSSLVRCTTKIVVQSKTLNLAFNYELTVDLESQDGITTLTIPVSGVWASPDPLFSTNIDFGGVLVGRSKTFFLQVENKGKFPLIVTQIYSTPPFSVAVDSFRVDGESKLFVPVVFVPPSEDGFSGSITFLSNIGELRISTYGHGVGSPFPSLYLQSTAVDFGVIFPDEMSKLNFVIFNVGAENLIIKKISSELQAFSVERLTFPFVLEPSKKLEFSLLFTPEKEGSFQSYIVIESSDPDKPYLKIPVSGRASKPNISIPKSINFETTRVYYQSKKDLSIVNSGLFPVVISQISVSEGVFSLGLDLPLPYIISYDNPITIPLIFSPQDATEYSGILRLSFIVPKSSTFSFSEYKNVELKIFEAKLYGIGGYPRIKLSKIDEVIDFGSIWVDESSSRSFLIENTGVVSLNANLYSDSDDFTISDRVVSVPPGGGYPVRISFVPHGKSGEIRGILRILSDDPLNKEITILLRGVSKVPEVVYKGGGCVSSEYISILGGITILLLVVFRRIKKLIVIAVISVIFSPTYGHTFSIIGLPNSYDRFFFARSNQTMPEGNIRFSLIGAYLSSPLFEAVYKSGMEVYKKRIFDYVFVSNPVFVYSLNNSTEIYFLPSVAYTQGEFSSVYLMDAFVGARRVIGSIGGYDIGSELFLGIPTGSKKYLGSDPFSAGAILILSKGRVSVNSGVIYGGKDIPFRFLLSGGYILNISRLLFFSLEGLSFFPLALKRGFIVNEVSASSGFDLGDVFLRIGASKGIVGGLGSADFRIMFSAGVNFNYKNTQNIKYFKLKGKIVDEFGNHISSCSVVIDKLFMSFKAKDGIFELNLPYGSYEVDFFCDGFMSQVVWISPNNHDLEVKVRKSSPLLVLYSSDESGIPIERSMGISIEGKTFNVSTYYIVLQGSREYGIEVDNLSRRIITAEGFATWLGIGRGVEGWAKASTRAGKDIVPAAEEVSKAPESDKIPVQEVEEKNEEKRGEVGGPEEREEKLEAGGLSEAEVSEEKRKEMLGKILPLEKFSKIEEGIGRAFPARAFSIYSAEGNIIFKKVIDSFQLGSATIPSQKYADLEEVVHFIKNNFENISEIIVEGHTDDIGKPLWNIELSYQRAESVRKFLISRGIIFPLKMVGYGDSMPIEQSYDDSLKYRNRRVEIKIFFKK